MGQNFLVTGLQQILIDLLQRDVIVDTLEFHTISNDYQRTKFLQEHMVLVRPVAVGVGHRSYIERQGVRDAVHSGGDTGQIECRQADVRRKRSSRGKVGTRTKYGYVMPLKDTLTLLLKNKDFYEAVSCSENKEGMKFENDEWVWTGEWGGTCEDDIKTIYLSISVDDSDICSQHKEARGKHKQCVCLFEVLNVSAKYRCLDKTNVRAWCNNTCECLGMENEQVS